MGGRLRINTGNRLERLLDLLADRLAQEPLPPLCDEVVIVPGQGMARWVTLELSRRLGVAASLRLPFPGAFLQQLLGDDELSRAFAREPMTWRIFALLGGGGFDAASLYCQDDPDQQKRFQLAAKLAATFDDYQFYRDRELAAFEQEREAPALRWQGRLWRALLAEFAGPAPGPQRLLFPDAAADAAAPSAHRLDRLRRLLGDPQRARAALPKRLSVFGASALPPAIVEVLFAIAQHIAVDLYVPKATPHYYGDLDRRDDGQPLLAACGAASRQFFDLLLDRDASGGDEQAVGFVDPGRDCLLHALQSDLLHLGTRGLVADPLLALGPADRSLTVHGAHGPLREMEVLRDQILDAFAADPTLRPGDVMVLLCDLDTYAPYVHAVFGPVQRVLPFTVADRSPAADQPVPAAMLRLLQLAQSRFLAPEVLLLLEEPALARTFGIARPDLPVLRRWVQNARIRWGIDGRHKQRDFGLPADDGHSWRRGLRRLVLGHATGSLDELVLGMLPLGDRTTARSELLGRFARFFDAIADLAAELRRPRLLAQWADQLERAAAALFTVLDDDERQGLTCLLDAAVALRDLAATSRLREEVSCAVFTTWLQQHLAAQGENRGFLTGAITFAALQPMRAVPMRLLAIAGLGDGEFPRRELRPGFDLLQQERRRGDRNLRDDDRQLFLDSLLAARDRLLLSYVARSAKDNSVCAPSPVLAELLDWIDGSTTPPPGFARSSEFVFVQHPLQSFSPRYGGGDARLFTYGRLRTPPAAPRPVAETPARAPATEIELGDLLQFWLHPARFFCRNVLGLSFPRRSEGDDDVEPFELSLLEAYRCREDAVAARLAGRSDPLRMLRHRDVLPAGALGGLAAGRLRCEVENFADLVAAQRGTVQQTVQVHGDGYVVRGTLSGLREDAQVLFRPASLKGKDRLRAFVLHAVLGAAADRVAGLPRRTILIGTDAMLQSDDAVPRSELDRLVAGYRQGCARPLPFFAHASFAYAAALQKQSDPAAALRAARRHFEPPREGAPGRSDLPDPDIELCFRDQDPLLLPEFEDLSDAVAQNALIWFPAEPPP